MLPSMVPMQGQKDRERDREILNETTRGRKTQRDRKSKIRKRKPHIKRQKDRYREIEIDTYR